MVRAAVSIVLAGVLGVSIAGPITKLPAGFAAAQSRPAQYWGDHERGWHFYEPPEPELDESPVPPKEQRRALDDAEEPPEVVQLKRLQKQVEQFRQVAIMVPSETNVRRYMELEARVVNQASAFADVARRVAWASPELDMTLQGRPVNAKALEVFERDQLQARSRSVATLTQTHVLFFFFRSDCPYCHAFAPTLQAFQQRHGIGVVPVSLDGGGLPGFDGFRRDNGISTTLGVSQVPAVFLAEPHTGKITPIGFGILSESELLERIATVSATGTNVQTADPADRASLQ